MFQRQNDLIKKWGGPNVDNVYRHARVDPALRYRIRGRMHSCEQFVLAIRAGFMHDEKWGTLHEVTATELGIAEGDEFEILVGGEKAGAITLPPDAATVSIREYYFSWRAEEPATFTIECLDAPPTIGGAAWPSMEARIDAAATAVTRSMSYWDEYLREHRAEQVDNTFGGARRLAKGLDAATYCFCFWNLAPNEALVVESAVPNAPYWGLQLYNLHWFESLDFANRVTSLNHEQIARVGDDRLRVVLAARDPGVANWLDSEGRPEGLLTFRWFWSRTDIVPVARVVPLTDVIATDVTPAERAAVIAARRAHVAWRFRT
jgi:hypothetical protein